MEASIYCTSYIIQIGLTYIDELGKKEKENGQSVSFPFLVTFRFWALNTINKNGSIRHNVLMIILDIHVLQINRLTSKYKESWKVRKEMVSWKKILGDKQRQADINKPYKYVNK